jgi:type IV pilus assembly protein PilA
MNKKGFTLVEMIVVIVVIAILIAALTPAVLGVVRRANVSADEADARSVLMVASMLAVDSKGTVPAQTGDNNFQQLIENEMSGGGIVPGALFTVHFEDNFPVTVVLTTNARSNGTVTVGRNPAPTGNNIQTRTFTAP